MDLTPGPLNAKAHQGLAELAALVQQPVTPHAPPPDSHWPFVIGWGLATNLRRQADAVVFLHQHDRAHESAPNRRMMIECMAQLCWLVEDGQDAVDSMNKAFQHSHGRLRAAVDEGGVFTYGDSVAAAADAVAAAVIPPNTKNQFNLTKKLLGRFGAGLTEAWLSETPDSHAGIAAAAAFFEQSPDGSIQLYDSPHYGGAPDPNELAPFMAFMLLYCGLEAFNDLMVGAPWTEELNRIGLAAGLPGGAAA
ncbi:hypothetical protein [Streptomyces sp. NPDC056401]|uniref:hypothetical protein n=1 Tax=Streptomyces sp. NPDC056401 TaxID=3345809 RepID=UPI0035D5D179